MHAVSKLSVAFVAALATAANAHGHEHQHMRRQFNGTASPYAWPSTSTVVLTTDTIATETATSSVVAPLSTGASSSVVAPLSTGASSFPLSTGVVAPISTGASSVAPIATDAPSASVTYVTIEETLTYTLGAGSSTTVVTTTIQSTSTEYLTETLFATAPTGSSGLPINSANATGLYPTDSTTTVQTTSTIIDTLTVYPTGTGYGALPTGYSAAPTGYSAPTGFPSAFPSAFGTAPAVSAVADVSSEACAVGTTTTVTEKETIYVTVAPTTTSTSTSSAPTVGPIQSSSAPYYPSSGAVNVYSGTASSTCYSTGFITIHKPSGASSGFPIATATVYPYASGYKPSGY